MKIVDCYRPKPPTARVAAQTWYEGVSASASASDQADFELQAEHHLEVRVEGRGPATLVCTPECLVELALGHLFAEGVIDGVDDVRLLHLNRPGTVATVVLRDEKASGEGTPFLALAPNTPPRDVAPVVTAPFTGWDLSWVKALTERFCSDTPMHRKTHGAHSCFIAVDGAVVFECEDIGRHNAFDKALGHALRRGIDLRRAMLFTSGRTPSDVIAKVVRAHIPVLVSAAVPTDQAVAMAQEQGVTLFSWARSGSFRLFSDPLGRGAELLRAAREGFGPAERLGQAALPSTVCREKGEKGGKVVGMIGEAQAV